MHEFRNMHQAEHRFECRIALLMKTGTSDTSLAQVLFALKHHSALARRV